MDISLIKTTPITICYFLILINKIAALRSYLKEVLEFTHKKIINKIMEIYSKRNKKKFKCL